MDSSFPPSYKSDIYKRSAQADPESTSYKKKWPKWPSSHSCYTAFSLPVCNPNLMGSPLQSVDKGIEDLGLVYRWFCPVCRCYLKVESYSTTEPPQDIYEELYYTEIFSMDRTLGSTPIVCTFLGRKSSQTCDYILTQQL